MSSSSSCDVEAGDGDLESLSSTTSGKVNVDLLVSSNILETDFLAEVLAMVVIIAPASMTTFLATSCSGEAGVVPSDKARMLERGVTMQRQLVQDG